ncbi:amidohydrolase family protein [Sphingomonas sp.]|jgi:imidazolonepropionase-like amidohydrolase|uniref:amidohydrolase family protein n=1 Tax=Sphingomonas sp. TaxID=28214 RepID=UPI002ED7854C
MFKHLRLAALLCIALLPGANAAAQVAPPRTIALRIGTALDGRGNVIRDRVILVVDGKIKAVTRKVPAGVPTYDLRRYTVLPGLIDTHEHIFYHFRDGRFVDGRLSGLDETPEEAILYAAENGADILAAGFTTIQSPGRAKDVWLRQAYARNVLPGPRVLTSGEWLRFDDPVGSAPPPDRLRAIVRERKAQGADFIKIFASSSARDGSKPLLTQPQMDALCDEARKQGLRTLVHAYTVSVRMAVQAGCTTIEHGTGGMTPEVIGMMVKAGTYFDPNVGLVVRNYVENRQKYIGIGNYTAASMDAMARRLAENAPPREFMLALKQPGLKIVFGTDAVAGAHGRNAEEFVYRIQRGGMDPMRAIVSATSLSAESLGLGDVTGTLAQGYEADIIALAGDPLKDPTAVRRPVFVMKHGRVFKFDPVEAAALAEKR